MTYRCRTTVPSHSDWHTVEASNPDDAAQEFHFQGLGRIPSFCYRHEMGGGRVRKLHFVMVEVEGHGERISRIIEERTWRRGGVQPAPGATLAEIARELRFDGEPEEMLGEW